jgi:Fe(3+) dicitrate transport protein
MDPSFSSKQKQQMKKFSLIIIFFIVWSAATAQTFSISGKITGTENSILSNATVLIKNTNYYSVADETGNYTIHNVKPGTYQISVSYIGYTEALKEVIITDKDLKIDFQLTEEILIVDSVEVKHKKEKTFGVTRLRDVEGTAIYAGKKSEVVVMDDITANTATNNSRQIYSKIAGLNIWENDGAGIQLGIGGRGLNPNRVSNFNTRQNGYDISADALGYPESYYSPPTEALDRIEIVRGAASLQYGTQFGGLVNFKLKKGPADKKIQLTSRQTLGSFGFFNTFNSVGGTLKKLNYYVYYQNKSGMGWRPNSQFNVNTAYASAIYKVNEKISITFQYTFMDYMAQQPGGLTDAEFEKNPKQSKRTRNWFRVNWNLGAAILDYKINDRLKFNTRFFGLYASRSALGVLTFINRADPMTERDLIKDQYKNYGNETRLLYTYNTKNNPSTLLVGFRYYKGFTDRRQGHGNSGSKGTKSDFNFIPDDPEYSKYTYPNHNIAVFAENIFQVSPRLSIIPGLRFENIQTRANGSYNIVNKDLAGNIIYNESKNEERKSVRSFILGGLGMSYQKSDNMSLYANISQNYRSINFNDMRIVNANFRVDQNLHDEKGYSADLGIRGNHTSIFNYDFSLFMISYKDRIGSVVSTDPVTLNTYSFRTNVSDSRNIGLESFMELDVWRLIKRDSAKMKIAVFSNFTLLDAKYVNSKQAAFRNKKVELVPNIILKTGLNFKRGKFAASYQFSYTGEQFTDATNSKKTNNAINGLIQAYYVMDVTAEYAISKNFALYGTVNNLTNRMYFTRRADSYPGPGIIPSDGRSFFLTLQIKI